MAENKNGKGKEFKLSPEDIQRVDEIICDRICADKSDVVPEANLKDDLYFDSLDFIELIMVLERDLHIHVPDAELTEINTVADVYNMVYEKTSKRN